MSGIFGKRFGALIVGESSVVAKSALAKFFGLEALKRPNLAWRLKLAHML